MEENILDIERINKGFVLPDKNRLVILQDLSLQVGRGRIVAITGVSGSGKSTFLHLVGALDKPDSGRILFAGEDILRLNEKKLNLYRNRTIGFVFQFHYLMPELTVLENVAAPFLVRKFDRVEAYKKSALMLTEVGLLEKRECMPHQLSGGEKQRVAIARSLINSPELLLADEPTGSLDWKTGEMVFGLFKQLIRDRGLTAIIVTHNPQIAALTDWAYLLHNGNLERL
jgi:lipoprotein-releasing system ATP-binding protein